RLLEDAPSPAEFLGGLLQRVLDSTGGCAGAVWTRSGPERFHLEYQVNREQIGLDGQSGGVACHNQLLRLAPHKDRPFWVPPRSGPAAKDDRPVAANRTEFGLLLAPILMEKETVGLLEIWLDPIKMPQPRKGVARLLTEAAAFAAAYLHKSHWQ